MNQNTLKKHNYNDDILLRKVLSKFFGRKCTSLLAKIDQIDQYRPLDDQNRPKSSIFLFFFPKNQLKKYKFFEKCINGRFWTIMDDQLWTSKIVHFVIWTSKKYTYNLP
jgi:hypothetical protein